jgi:hypothetical protein
MAIIPNSQKTFSVNEGVNTVYGGSASMKALSQWYTMQDITDTVRPYKVYTALLTQDGSSEEEVINSGPVEIGTTYSVGTPKPHTPWDFTNVGGPKYPDDYTFVATSSDIPNSYGSASLSFDLGAPVVTVLENTIGDIWFTYNSVGNYSINSDNCFSDNKTVVMSSPKGYIESPADICSFDVSWTTSNSDQINISSYFNNELADDALNYGGAAMIEIRVYN